MSAEAMQARVVAVIAERLAMALAVMPQVCPSPDPKGGGVLRPGSTRPLTCGYVAVELGRAAVVLGVGVEVESPLLEQAPRRTTTRTARASRVVRVVSGGWCMASTLLPDLLGEAGRDRRALGGGGVDREADLPAGRLRLAAKWPTATPTSTAPAPDRRLGRAPGRLPAPAAVPWPPGPLPGGGPRGAASRVLRYCRCRWRR